MTSLQKITLEQSEARQRLGELAGIAEPSEAECTEMEALTGKLGALEVRYRAAVASEGPAPANGQVEPQLDSEARELVSLEQRVSIGTRVLCLDLESREEVTYTLLGEADAVPEQNVISYQSALGRGLIGKELDDDADIVLPAGTRRLRILDIQRFDSE